MTNLSQWFLLSEQTPWEAGVYEVEVKGGSPCYSYFDGSALGWVCGNMQSEHIHRREGMGEYVFKWRGLSTSPEVKKKPGNQRKQFVIVMEAAGENLERQHPVGVFEDEKNADVFLAIHQKRCPKFYYYKSWTPRFRTPE